MGKVKLDFLYNYQLKLRLFFIIFFLVALDQISKFLIINNLETNQSENIFNLLSFTFVKNYGVAFSFLNNESFNMSGLIVLLVFLICIILFLYIFTSVFKEKFSVVEYFAFSLILAGGLGNFIDRVSYGFVIDFIDISFNPYIFNLADSYVTIGILIYIIKSLFFNKENESHKIS